MLAPGGRRKNNKLLSVLLSKRVLRVLVILSCACSLFVTFFLLDSTQKRYQHHHAIERHTATDTDDARSDNAAAGPVGEEAPGSRRGGRDGESDDPTPEKGLEAGEADEGDEEGDEEGEPAVSLEPIILTIEPYHGAAVGRTTITIKGHNLGRRDTGEDDETEISASVGGVPCITTVSVDNETVTCETPAGAGEGKSVSVTKMGKETQIESPPNTLFSYDGPVVDRVRPGSGQTSGGTRVTVHGSNFGPADVPLQVTIGNLTCEGVLRVSDSEATCKTPPQGPGPKNVSVGVWDVDHWTSSEPKLGLYEYALTWAERLEKHSGELLEGLGAYFDGIPLVLNKNANFKGHECVEEDVFAGRPILYTVPPSLLEVSPQVDLEHKKHKTCALVCNSNELLSRDHGSEIDGHEAVFRFNNAPTTGFEKHVGGRTTYRFSQTKFLRSLLVRDPELRKKVPKVSKDDVLLATSEASQDLYVLLRRTFPHSKTFLVSHSFRTNSRLLYAELRQRFLRFGLEEDERRGGRRGLQGRDVESLFDDVEPPSGFLDPPPQILGILFAQQMCNKLDVYGLGPGGGTASSYFSEGSGDGSEGAVLFGVDEAAEGREAAEVGGIDDAIASLLASGKLVNRVLS
ncbi:hypothetical protein A3770_03p22190 [Chloropicon primus]|uniref:IPT/TIG domain-containing protein n=1 Tax=Chloropicon primus TaxID=1764295 RepID=A0A5B8MHD9_9CHLO|nr:hypothetical protein A3770_03p22190 [Chloropicon primus]|eukprot:QDZ19701.1 hypothetical protein A3770_03p22190 [Chloropicon primus]